MRTFRFYKEKSGRWYVDIPDFPGDKAELEMVCGADTMLDIYAQGLNNIKLTFSVAPPKCPYDVLTLIGPNLIAESEFGSDYKVSTIRGVDYDFQIWLCSVTTYVFGGYPEKIYIC